MSDLLYPHQSNAVDRLAKGETLYLGFDPGLGKTRTVLEAARRKGVRRLLVISPASGLYVWEREAHRWFPAMPFFIIRGPADFKHLRGDLGIFVVTYGLVSQKESPVVSLLQKSRPFDMTALDEAAALKNSGANRTKAVFGKLLSSGKLGHIVPMSGTPAPNHNGEMYPVLKALYPSAASSGSRLMYEWEFQDAFCKVVKRRFGPGGREVRTIDGSKNTDELRKRMDGFMLRVRKEDVLKDLPPIRWDIVPVDADVDMQMPDMSRFDEISDEDLIDYLRRGGANASGGEHIMRLRHLLGLAKVQAAVDYINDLLVAMPADRKLVVFAHHQDVIALLMAGLAGWSPQVIVGASSLQERTFAVSNFLGHGSVKSRLFIGNIQAAGTAITLVGPNCKCSDVVFVEATYSVGDNVQAACRVHRIGQSDAVVARYLVVHGTIDDRIHQILARKASDFAQLFD